MISGIILVLRNGLRWRDAPREYGPHKTIYNRFIRWSRLRGLAPVAIQPAPGLQHQLAQPDRTWVHLGAGRIEHELFVDPGIERGRDRNQRQLFDSARIRRCGTKATRSVRAATCSASI